MPHRRMIADRLIDDTQGIEPQLIIDIPALMAKLFEASNSIIEHG